MTDMRFQKSIPIPVSSLCLLFMDKDLNCQLLLQRHTYVMPFPYRDGHGLCSPETASHNKLFLLYITFVIASLDSNRKATKRLMLLYLNYSKFIFRN